MSSKNILFGIIAGAATGAVLGILFSTEKGSIIRDQLSQKGEEFLGNLKSKFDDFLETATSGMQDAKSEAEDILAQGKEKVQTIKNDFNNIAEPL